jgi:hypothetical protein
VVLKEISEAGMRFDDSRIQALLHLPEATTADQLKICQCSELDKNDNP